MQKHLIIVTAAFLITGCAKASDDSLFKVTTKRDEDQVTVAVKMGRPIISIHSPFGISQAVIESPNRWPDPLALHLHLKGLEHFEVSNGRVTLEAAVPMHGEQAPVRQWRDGHEDRPLDSDSPWWIRFHSSSSDADAGSGNSSDDQFFEIHLPSMLLKDKPKAITVSWIDFYR